MCCTETDDDKNLEAHKFLILYKEKKFTDKVIFPNRSHGEINDLNQLKDKG